MPSVSSSSMFQASQSINHVDWWQDCLDCKRVRHGSSKNNAQPVFFSDATSSRFWSLGSFQARMGRFRQSANHRYLLAKAWWAFVALVHRQMLMFWKITLRTSGWFCMFPRIFPPREGWNTSWCKARWKSLEAHPGALMGFPACFECPSELHRSSDPEVLKFIFLVTEGNHIGTDLPITIYHALWLSSSQAFKGCIV